MEEQQEDRASTYTIDHGCTEQRTEWALWLFFAHSTTHRQCSMEVEGKRCGWMGDSFFPQRRDCSDWDKHKSRPRKQGFSLSHSHSHCVPFFCLYVKRPFSLLFLLFLFSIPHPTNKTPSPSSLFTFQLLLLSLHRLPWCVCEVCISDCVLHLPSKKNRNDILVIQVCFGIPPCHSSLSPWNSGPKVINKQHMQHTHTALSLSLSLSLLSLSRQYF